MNGDTMSVANLEELHRLGSKTVSGREIAVEPGVDESRHFAVCALDAKADR